MIFLTLFTITVILSNESTGTQHMNYRIIILPACALTGVMEVGGPGGHRPTQFFRLGGHRGAQSILITSSESVSSYSIVTWC